MLKQTQNVAEHLIEQTGEVLESIGEGIKRTGKGFIAGAIGGLIASWVMNQYQEIESHPVAERRRLAAQPASPQPPKPKKTPDDATVRTAQAISTRLLHHELSDCEKRVAGPAIHYIYGSLAGGLYGAVAELWRPISSGLGVPYATAMWLFGDEVAVPALGLSKSAIETPPAQHATALASHFVYGISLDVARRIARHLV